MLNPIAPKKVNMPEPIRMIKTQFFVHLKEIQKTNVILVFTVFWIQEITVSQYCRKI